MPKAKKLPSGNWRCRASVTDEYGVKHTESFTEATPALAEAKATAWRAGLLERTKTPAGLTLARALDEHIETCRATGLSPATIRAYVSSSKNAFGALPGMRLSSITTRHVQLWVNARSQTVSPKTLKNNLALLSAVLRANGVKLDLDAVKRPRIDHSEMEIPSDAQVSQLLEAVYDNDDMYIAVALAALMGLRRSEICALRWSDIQTDGNAAYLDVSRALVLNEDAVYVEKDPKTNAGRRLLVIPNALYAELKRRRSLRSNLVNTTPNAITRRYQLLTEALGLPPRFHNLRHYHASVMLREGVPEKYIVADMGHASFDMVKRVYGHVMQEKRGAINAAMDEHSLLILSGKSGDTKSDTTIKKC